MPSTVKSRASKKAAAATPELRTESEIVADAIVARYRDLAPSVNRIMQAGLGEAARLHAITLFERSLNVPDDPMRHPLNAIAAAEKLSPEPG